MRRELVKTERRRGLRSGTPGRQRRTKQYRPSVGVEVAQSCASGNRRTGGSRCYGVSVGALLKLNAMGRRAVMQPRQRLRIPARGGHSKAGY